jgi:hypothetical protein
MTIGRKAVRHEVKRFLCRAADGARVAIVEYENRDDAGKVTGPLERWTDTGEAAEHVNGDTYKTASGTTLVRIR